jgi:ethanolamine kinase
MGAVSSPSDAIRYIPLYYDSSNSENSALTLILTLRPEWKETKDTIEFVKFTDGITNTVSGDKCWGCGSESSGIADLNQTAP